MNARTPRETIRRKPGYQGIEIGTALQELGVDYGEDFVIFRAADLAEAVNPNGASRRDDIDTANEAAKITRDGQAGRVLRTLGALGEATRSALANILNLPRDSVTPRVGALKRMGLIEETGKRIEGESVVRLTPTGVDRARELAS